MGKMILVTGGARSGKSTFAESLIKQDATACYLATSAVQSDDVEMLDRIEKHQAQRPKNWVTEERYRNIATFLKDNPNYDYYLLDCATLLSLNYFYSVMTDKFGTDYSAIDKEIASFSEEEKNNMEKIIMTEWLSIVSAVRDIPGDVIIVTNEVGWGIVPENPFSRWFRDIYGRVNQYLGKKSDAVYLVVAGIPMEIKK